MPTAATVIRSVVDGIRCTCTHSKSRTKKTKMGHKKTAHKQNVESAIQKMKTIMRIKPTGCPTWFWKFSIFLRSDTMEESSAW